MEKVYSVNTFARSIENEGIGYAIEDYWGRDIPTDDEKLKELWAKAYDALQELSSYIDANATDIYDED